MLKLQKAFREKTPYLGRKKERNKMAKTNFLRILTILVLFTVLGDATTTTGNVIYVDEDAPASPIEDRTGGANDGSSWENAYRFLQDALAAASDGDEIRVAQGVYKPDQGANQTLGDWTATFELVNGYGVTIKGGYAGYGKSNPDARDTELYETILSGDLYGNDVDISDAEYEISRAENSYHVISSDGFAVIDGLTITGGNANESSHSGGNGGALYNSGSVQITNCKFIENLAIFSGGAIYNYRSDPNLINCIFTNNSAGSGGGGGIHNSKGSPNLINCTFTENSASEGGGMSNDEGSPTLTNCIFIENAVRNFGGGIYGDDSSPILTNCAFIGNTAGSGGGMNNFNRNHSGPILINCLFNGNRARTQGGGVYNYWGEPILNNCTFAWNSAEEGNALACRSEHERNTVRLYNCILWDGGNEIWNNDLSIINIFYSNIRGGWFGEGNIDEDPLFVDILGPDHVLGTKDDNLRLSPSSPCVESGDPNYMSGPNETDLGGNRRIAGRRIDMGAYEFQGWIYVDDDAPYETWRGEPEIDYPQEDGTEERPFDTIQEAIDMAEDGYTILVRPGVYDKIDFRGKAIMVTGIEGAAVIEAPSIEDTFIFDNQDTFTLDNDAVTFHTGEGPGSVLKNFVIKNSNIAISLNFSSPKIHNVTIVNNNFGIAAYENSNPDIRNCILWDNRDGDLFQCEAQYSCIESRIQGEGNLHVNPLFVDAANGDYHLMSEGWRWNTNSRSWTWDEVTSRCIDAGDPSFSLGEELMSVSRDPDNMYGINRFINMGAFGGTYQASMAPIDWLSPVDVTAPVPNPAQWDSRPREINLGGGEFDFWVQMTAVEATDDSGLVEYFFECTTESGFSSGWQSSNTYSVKVGRGEQLHRFRVKARDLYLNETDWSDERMAF